MFETIDPKQLRRIESVHRGFLYQHLFGAGCLLLAAENNVEEIRVERDEDIEVLLHDRLVYCQIKTREDKLTSGDIADTLDRFDILRREHSKSRHSLKAEFWIVSNSEPNGPLAFRMKEDTWPADVRITYPGCTKHSPEYFPPPWRDLNTAVEWCSLRAGKVPLGRLSGPTLAWKLAALVHHASTGESARNDHGFRTTELPSLFEQIILQLQRFPAAPEPYRELQDEPSLDEPDRIRLITGFSGSGKTSWAAECARHSGANLAYFDVSGIPAEAFASSLTRELSARSEVDSAARSTLLAPGMSGIDSLRILDRYLQNNSKTIQIVVDNVHKISASTVAVTVAATSHMRWLILAQPGLETGALAAALGVEGDSLLGFTLDSIAAEFRAVNIPISALTADRILRITGGLPLFTRQAASMADKLYGKRVEVMCDELEARTHTVSTAQELLLNGGLSALPQSAREAAAVLSLSDISLTAHEARRLICDALRVSPAQAAASIRLVSDLGIISCGAEEILMHDSFRLVSGNTVSAMPADTIFRAFTSLKEIIIAPGKKGWDFSRQSFLYRLLPQIGETKTLVDLATHNDEIFAEHGYVSLVRPLLQNVVEKSNAPASDRFWALDTLLFWDFQENTTSEVGSRLTKLEQLLLECGTDDVHKRAAFALKQLLKARLDRDIAKATSIVKDAETWCGDDPARLLIFKYNLATTEFLCGVFELSARHSQEIIAGYYTLLGLREEDVNFASQLSILQKLRNEGEETFSNLKRVGDAHQLLARALKKLGLVKPLARIHAHKFYVLGEAITSAVGVGQDAADDFVERGDYEGALMFLDQYTLPIVEEFKLLEYVVPVRAQRAVVLAYLGEEEECREELDNLEQFAIESPTQRAEFKNQQRLVESILSRRRTLIAEDLPDDDVLESRWQLKQKIGRNDLCPCGSGKKYKRCCLRNSS